MSGTGSPYGFGLQLQQLIRSGDRVLVVADLAGRRNGDGWFSTKDVEQLFEDLRVAKPAIRATLSHFTAKDKDLIVARERQPKWAVTPRGRKKVHELVGDIDPAKLEPQLTNLPGVEIGTVHHTVLPPSLAPARWSAGISELLNRHPFETNVLCMTRFPRPSNNDDPNEGVINTARAALEHHGLTLHLANDAAFEDTLFANVAAYMWGCQYGLALFEDRVDEGLNHNLAIEVGAMIMAGRQTALLRDARSVDRMPTNLGGHIYKDVDFGQLETIDRAVHLWAADDLGLGRCGACPK